MSIHHRIKPRYPSRQHEIIANLRAEVGAGPPIDPYMKVKRLTAEVAVTMALVHGGEWRVVVDHDAPMVLIRPC